MMRLLWWIFSLYLVLPGVAAFKHKAGRIEHCNIFTMWNYSRPVPEYIHLNLQSWERASGGRCGKPVLINRTNVRQWIPDAPEELFRIPYEAAESDAIRYALIYHNGGVYMDTDFLAIDMTSIIDRIQDHDIITYTAEGQKFHKGQFSSNFLAGKKGSKVMGAIWKSQKEHMQRHCPKDMVPKSGMCCYDDPSLACSVRWAGLGEGISHPALINLFKRNESFKSYIFDGDESFVPTGLVEVLKRKLSVSDALAYWKRRSVKQPLSRKLYHLFNSQGFADAYSCFDLTADNTTAGHQEVPTSSSPGGTQSSSTLSVAHRARELWQESSTSEVRSSEPLQLMTGLRQSVQTMGVFAGAPEMFSMADVLCVVAPSRQT